MKNFKWLGVLALYVLVFAAQMTVGGWLQIFGIAPDFVLIFIVSVALRYGPAAGCFWGFLSGFTLDVYAPVEWLGANAMALTVVGFCVGQLEERILKLNLPGRLGVLCLAFFLCDLVYYLITGLGNEVVTTMLVMKTLPECAYTLLVGGIFFYLKSEKTKNHV